MQGRVLLSSDSTDGSSGVSQPQTVLPLPFMFIPVGRMHISK
jgi:hypothetical protein